MPYWPDSFPTVIRDRGVNWDYVFERDVRGSIKVLVHYLRETAGIYENSFDLPGSDFESDNQCVIMELLYSLHIFVREAQLL